MRILAVDTAEQSCSIALVEDEVTLSDAFVMNKQTHSRSLMDMIAHMLGERSGVNIRDIDGFVAAHGPGSFTGLRIGISVVKGLACAVSKPVAGISSLDGIAWQFSTLSTGFLTQSTSSNLTSSSVSESSLHRLPLLSSLNLPLVDSTLSVCAMMDAKRGEVYCAFYRFENGHLLGKSLELVIAPEKAAEMAGKGMTLFVGSGAAVFRKEIQHICGSQAHFAPSFQNCVRASALAHVLFQNPDLLSLGHDALMPVYLRRSDAEINYKQRR